MTNRTTLENGERGSLRIVCIVNNSVVYRPMLPLGLNQQNTITPPPTVPSLSSSSSMDPSQHLQLQQPPAGPPAQQSPSQIAQPTTKRRKRADGGEDAPAPAEPRRLRRSHEACARCRSKKIKASPASGDTDGNFHRQFLMFSHLFPRRPVRFQASKMYSLQHRRNRVQPRGQAQTDTDSQRLHRTSRAAVSTM